ncbi:flavin-containing monooxygenase [Pendulispora albinea]|uniref:NAD(P)/FAD-dependent oxidoreductase n=1 Tax=Pendulispora albinea TaxID=2741071 RepID=A0ABZ2LVG2_9BACT
MGNDVLEVAIVGAGFSGLGMAIRLLKAGISNFRIFEKAGEVGGTWRDNTYPGCACDVPSQLYSYSFEPNPDWSHEYGRQPEIQRYLLHCTEKYGLRSRIRFHSEITGAQFDEAAGEWVLRLNEGESVRARVVVSARGPFAGESMPAIEGADSFQGIRMHTARWNDGVALRGKRVALIGTGASAVQVGPAIAPEVAELTVFQRTPPWILPRPDRAITVQEKALNRALPPAMKVRRLGMYWFHELSAPFLILQHDWFKRPPQELARAHLRRSVKDRALRTKLTPRYKFGCKRVLLSSDWYPMLQRDNVRLIDEGVTRITEKGILTRDGVEHAFDVLVYATGYKVPLTEAPFAIHGLGGRTLGERFKDGAEAYKGMATAGFPNLFFLVGPFTGPGHQSVIAYAEAQMDYACQAILYRRQRRLKYVDVKREREARFVREMDWRSQFTVWTSGCASWYLSPNGRNNALYPGYNVEYRMRLLRFDPEDYELVAGDGAQVRAGLRDHVRTWLTALA